MLSAPHQNRDFVLARYHAAINADIHHASVVVLGDATPISEEIASAVEAVPPRRRQLIQVDVIASDDILLHRSGADDLGLNTAVEHIAAELDEIARVGIGSDAEHHGDAAVACKAAAEHAPAAGVRPIILDIVEHHGRSVADALCEPHHGAELDVPVDLRIDLPDLAGGVQ